MPYIVQNSGIIFRQDLTFDINAPRYQAIVRQSFSTSDSIKFVLTDPTITTAARMLSYYRAYLCNSYGRRIECPKQASVIDGTGAIWFQVSMNQMRRWDICWIEVQENYNDPTFGMVFYSEAFKIFNYLDGVYEMTNETHPQRKNTMLISGTNTSNYDGIYLDANNQNIFPTSQFGIRVNVSFYRTPKRTYTKEVYEEHFGKKTNLRVETFDVWTIKFTGMTNEQANVVKTLLNTDSFMIGDYSYRMYGDELEEITVDGVKEYSLSGEFINIGVDSDKYDINIFKDPMEYFSQDTKVTPPKPIGSGLRILRLGRKSNQTDLGI